MLPCVADTDTLHRLETLIGKEWVEQISTSLTRGDGFVSEWHRGTYRTEAERSRIAASAIRELPPHHVLTIRGRSRADLLRAVERGVTPFSFWWDDGSGSGAELSKDRVLPLRGRS